MSAYYNDNDPYCCAWLSNLMDAGEILAGTIDDRSIHDISPDDIAGFARVHFFAGLGGWEYALGLAGWDDSPVWTASCPCQPFSVAGKREGFADERDLWPVLYSLVAKRQPPVVFGEQVAGADEWLSRAKRDLEEVGYAVGAEPIPASVVGAPHNRPRMWFVADAEWNEQPRQEPRSRQAGRVGRVFQSVPWDEPWQSALPRLRAMDDGIPRNVEATDAARNAIVPQVAAEFMSAYLEARAA